MSTLAPGDMHNDHQDAKWWEKVTTHQQRLRGDAATTERPQTPRQALLWLTSQYTPVTDDDHKAMFILTRFINGNGDWSEVGYQQHQRMQRLAQAEAKVDERRRERVQQFIDNARG